MITESFWYSWVLIPAMIFLARVADVTIGTVRIVFISKGLKMLAPLLGFFEIFIWLIAMTKIFQNLDNWFYFIAYSGGFATGNYIGLKIEEKLALGYVNLQIITQNPGEELAKKLASQGFGVTWHEAHGSRGEVTVIYCVIKRSGFKEATSLIKEYNPKAFYIIEDVRFANQGVFPVKSLARTSGNFPRRKGK
ncbi:DUF2179 domain-containing protein [Thermophagus xiamenensis]|uniref:UPF0316 protein SAMN05444380_104124 n=1 Tax=Thermophagus xiamenensis TaxID=385682 RepID=A0A1I1WJ31_9BACT|nr:DUF2179 domain-containing protein [Thermophagus xiamenensis]SFD94991.1 Uncharacterized protein YebE, UPF0316 family [Thermophagus xiamenensis]